MLSFPCPQCKATLKAPEEKVGAHTNCPWCKSPVEIPGRVVAGPPAVAQAIRFSCPTCKSVMAIPVHFAGQKTHCTCGQKLQVPIPAPPKPAPTNKTMLGLEVEQASAPVNPSPPIRPITPMQIPTAPLLDTRTVATEAVQSNGHQLTSAADGTRLIAGLHRQRFAIAVAAGCGMLATFLPWLHAPIVGSIYGTAGWGNLPYANGWMTLVLFIPAMVLVLRGAKTHPVIAEAGPARFLFDDRSWGGTRTHPVIGNARLGAAIPAGIAAFIGLLKIVDFKWRMGTAPNAEIAALVTFGIGIYLVIAAGIALVVLAWVMAKPPAS